MLGQRVLWPDPAMRERFIALLKRAQTRLRRAQVALPCPMSRKHWVAAIVLAAAITAHPPEGCRRHLAESFCVIRAEFGLAW